MAVAPGVPAGIGGLPIQPGGPVVPAPVGFPGFPGQPPQHHVDISPLIQQLLGHGTFPTLTPSGTHPIPSTHGNLQAYLEHAGTSPLAPSPLAPDNTLMPHPNGGGVGITSTGAEQPVVHPAISALLHALAALGGGGGISGAHLGNSGYGPAVAMHHLGHNDAAAAQLWEQHHPEAMRTGRFIPSWVRAVMGPSHGAGASTASVQ